MNLRFFSLSLSFFLHLHVAYSLRCEHCLPSHQTNTQGTPGEKGQKGDVGQPAIDVFQAVKVFSFFNIIFQQSYFITPYALSAFLCKSKK